MLTEMMVVGQIQANCYLVGDGKSKDIAIIDPGGDGPDIIARIEDRGYNPVYIINTHGHIDHMWANADMKAAYPDAELLIHEADAQMLTNSSANLSGFMGLSVTSPPPDRTLSEGDHIKVGSLDFEIVHIPGHSAGGIALITTDDGTGKTVVFCGDALFAYSIGRTDFPGGSYEKLVSGIKEKLLNLPDDTVVYPGHGPATTIGTERQHNPFLQD
jgi:glyoxylase-like metal-dependent hydrolase (beta-lactamase superfamily II)